MVLKKKKNLKKSMDDMNQAQYMIPVTLPGKSSLPSLLTDTLNTRIS